MRAARNFLGYRMLAARRYPLPAVFAGEDRGMDAVATVSSWFPRGGAEEANTPSTVD
jgi:hypothetical protein